MYCKDHQKPNFKITAFFHLLLLIYYEDIYVASSKSLLRSAPIQHGLKGQILGEHGESEDPKEPAPCQRKPIPEREANHREGGATMLTCERERDDKNTLFSI